jgi:ABC-type sulfate transport system substrate-binding protein
MHTWKGVRMNIYSIYSLDFSNSFKLIIRAADKKSARKAAKAFFHYHCFDEALEKIASSPRKSKCTYEGRAAKKYKPMNYLCDVVLCATIREE